MLVQVKADLWNPETNIQNPSYVPSAYNPWPEFFSWALQMHHQLGKKNLQLSLCHRAWWMQVLAWLSTSERTKATIFGDYIFCWYFEDIQHQKGVLHPGPSWLDCANAVHTHSVAVEKQQGRWTQKVTSRFMRGNKMGIKMGTLALLCLTSLTLPVTSPSHSTPAHCSLLFLRALTLHAPLALKPLHRCPHGLFFTSFTTVLRCHLLNELQPVSSLPYFWQLCPTLFCLHSPVL